MSKIDESELMPTTSPEKTEQFESDKDSKYLKFFLLIDL